MISESTSEAITARPNPPPSAMDARRTGRPVRSVIPRAAPRMASYSGPTTIAPTTRICELVRMPMDAINPADTNSRWKLKG